MENPFIKKSCLWLGALLLIAAAFWFGRTPSQAEPAPELDRVIQQQIRVGDWVFRQGRANESSIIMQLSGSPYSHVGMVSAVTPQIQIVHATTDDDAGRQNQVLVSSLQDFVSPRLAKGWAVYRHVGLNEMQRRQSVAWVKSQVGLPFIVGVRGESARYCTTIIAEGLPIAVQNTLQWQRVDVPAFHGDLLFPKALIEAKDVQLIYKSVL